MGRGYTQGAVLKGYERDTTSNRRKKYKQTACHSEKNKFFCNHTKIT